MKWLDWVWETVLEMVPDLAKGQGSAMALDLGPGSGLEAVMAMDLGSVMAPAVATELDLAERPARCSMIPSLSCQLESQLHNFGTKIKGGKFRESKLRQAKTF